MSIEEKLALLKQFLAQAEMSDKKTLGATKVVGLQDDSLDVRNDLDTGPNNPNSQLSQPYRKSKILDALGLQLAAVLKFDLNLFRVTYEIPVRLLARLYRVLVAFTAKNSPSLQPLFDQADDKENIFIVNPYARFSWQSLHPTTTYAVLSYHIWCLHVSFASSMLPQPFRNLTPFVAGLTEVPDTVFFADNRVEIGVILGRIKESVAQIIQISSLLDTLTIARPFPSMFPFIGPGLPPALGAPIQADPEGKIDMNDYLSLSFKFILGRHAFQQQQLERAEELFEAAWRLMVDCKVDYAEEVGATPELVETYLKACRSYRIDSSPDDIRSSAAIPCEFVETFCRYLSRGLSAASSSKTHTRVCFWQELLKPKASPEVATVGSGDGPTLEDHLCQLLMEDIHLEDNKRSSELIVPLGISLRENLEHLCYQQLTQALSGLNIGSSNSAHGQTHGRHSKTARSSTDGMLYYKACQQLYTKVLICNTVERLVSGSFYAPSQLVTLLFGNPTDVEGGSKVADNRCIQDVDAILAQEFLFDCLNCFLVIIRNRRDDLSLKRCQLVCQYLTYIIEEGLVLFSDCISASWDNQRMATKHNVTSLVSCLMEHDLFRQLPCETQEFIHSTFAELRGTKKDTDPSQTPCASNYDLPDPAIGLQESGNHGFGLNWDSVDSWTKLRDDMDDKSKDSGRPGQGEAGIFASSKDVDMRALVPPYNAPQFAGSVSLGCEQHGNQNFPPLGSAEEFYKEATAFTSNALAIRTLLTAVAPADVSSSVRVLYPALSHDRILELNSGWLPTLHRLASLELPSGINVPNDMGEEDPIRALLTSDSNVVTVLTMLIELAKAALLLQHQITSFHEVRLLILASLNEWTNLRGVPSTSKSLVRVADPYRWVHAAIRHELLLTDLLEVLDPPQVSINPSSGCIKQSRSNQKSTVNRFQLHDLSRRARVCILSAAGLSSTIPSMETKVDPNIPIGLSVQLVSAAACFLLMNKEREFLLPSSKQAHNTGLPKGSLSSRGSYLGAIELIRALLRMHDAVSAEMKSKSLIRNVDESMDIKNEQRPSSPTRGRVDSRSVTHDSLKTAVNNLWNLVVFGCLIPELTTPSSGIQHESGVGAVPDQKSGSGRSQLQLSTMLLVARMLACTADRPELSALKTQPDSRKKGPPEPGSAKKSPSLHLLNYLIICLAHITRSVCPKFSLPISSLTMNKISGPVDDTNAESGLKTDSDANMSTGASDHGTKQDEPESTDPRRSRRKRTRWDTPSEKLNSDSKQSNKGKMEDVLASRLQLHTSLLLSRGTWPTDLPSGTQLSEDSIFPVLNSLLATAITVLPDQVSWLELRAEMEFIQGRYREALCTDLEIFAVATDSFILRLTPSVLQEQTLSRMIRSCQSLGLLGEAVILCQMGPDDCFIDLGIQLINTLIEPPTMVTSTALPIDQQAAVLPDTNGGVPQPDSTRAGQPINAAKPTNTQTTVGLSDNPLGACGGTLRTAPLDCIDHLIEYIWDVRLLESLSTAALNEGALLLQSKFRACFSIPELNSNNPDPIRREVVDTLCLEFLRWMADQYLA
ncbi:unnamed protein product [Calicophoron daubneyi]|uniref:INTS8 TPR repeats domain-containing protein n=1 Tax=Calicophoron daubneyi TaxID=300641 RepID=A0AAV2T5A4_CALDB